MATTENRGLRWIGWVVNCIQCGRQGSDPANVGHQSLACGRLLRQGWSPASDGLWSMDTVGWLCPECKGAPDE